MVYTSKTEQFALVVFLAVFVVPISMTYVYAEEELIEVPAAVENNEAIQSDVQNTDSALPQENTEGGEEVAQDTPGEVATSTEETQPIPTEEVPVTDTPGGEDSTELIETPHVTIALETISQAIASSSQNEDLPFKLTSSKMNFALNEVPTFTFSYTSDKADGPIESFVENIVSAVTNTVSDLYEDSFVETIVDAVVDTVDSVVDLIIPTAEGQEVVPDTLQEVEPTDTKSETDVSTSSVETGIATSTADTVNLAKDEASTTSIATTTPMAAFVIIDTVRYTVSVTYTEEGVFVVDLVNAVFGVGVHTLELHIPFKGELHVAYYTFSVDGTVVSMRVLQEGITVLVVADQFGIQTLWLERLQENGVRSFQQIADETTMAQNPVLEFKDNTLFWTTPLKEALIGFDVVSNSSFSQTLNLRASEKNSIELHNGTYDVSVTPEDIDVTFIPEKL